MHSQKMLILKNKLSIIENLINDKEDVIFIDTPLHLNIGDLLIFIGSLSFFQEKNIYIKAFFSAYDVNIDYLRKISSPNTTFLFHGGGNFGDLYPLHQKLREEIVKNFPNNRLILLPQTAYFQQQDNLLASQKIFNNHSDIILCARDLSSLAIFKKFSKQCYLVPDMAHALYGTLSKKATPSKKEFYFLRKDIETLTSQEQPNIEMPYKVADWEDLITLSDRVYLKFILSLSKANKIFHNNWLNKAIYKLWNYKASSLSNKFSLYFSDHTHITTSRLHGHILSCLVDTPSTVLDNSYGKNSSYYNLWTKNSPITSDEQENNI